MRSVTVFAAVLLTALLRPLAAQEPYPATAGRIQIQHCIVTLAEQADLSPNEAGILKQVKVKSGDRVDAGQVLLQLDDRKALAERDQAKAKLDAANEKANDDVNIKYSEAADKTSKSEYDRNVKSNRDVPGSVPAAKLEELKLKTIETTLAIEKAKHDRKVAEAEAGIAAAELKAAEVMIELLKVRSPIDGMVVAVRAHNGEAVSPAQPMLQVARLDKLWVEGQVSAAEVSRQKLENQSVTVEVASEAGKASIPGKIVFVSPLTETGGTYLVRAEIKRESPESPWPINSGMQADMTGPLK